MRKDKVKNIHTIRLILFLISAFLISYLLILEKGINPKINHHLEKHCYFWCVVFITTIIFALITYLITILLVYPCIVNPIFNGLAKL
jgi:hypothetical protein